MNPYQEDRRFWLPIHGDAEYLDVMKYAESGDLYSFGGDDCVVVDVKYDGRWKRGEFRLHPVKSATYGVVAVISPDDEPKPNHVRDAARANR